MVQKFSPRLTTDDVSNRNFKDVETLSTEIIRGRVLDNVIIEGITLSSSLTQVSHTLNRRPLGWVVIRKNADVNVWEPSESPSPTRLISLQATSDVTIDVLFF